MRDYRDVKKRLSALAVCGLLVFSTYASDIQLIAENGEICENFVDAKSWDEQGTLIVDENGDLVPDGYCDECGRDMAAHLSLINENEQEAPVINQEPDLHVHTDEDADNICDTCQEIIDESLNNPNPCNHIDEDSDLICDLCGEALELIENEEEFEPCQHIDEDEDGICDLCEEILEVVETEEEVEEPCQHEDAEIDGICDLCGEELPLLKQIFSETINGKIISVSGPIPRGGYVTIESYSNWYAERIINNNYDENFEVFEAYDINIYDADGEPYQPAYDDNTVKITIAGVEEIAQTPDDEIQVLRFEEDDVTQIEELEVLDVTGDAATFESEHFTIVVVGKPVTLTYNEASMDNYRILCQSGAATQATGYMLIKSADIHLYLQQNEAVQFYAYVRRGFTNVAQPMADGETIATGYFDSDNDAKFDTSTAGWKNINIEFDYEAGVDKYFKPGAKYAVVLKFFDTVTLESGIGNVGTTYVALTENASTFVNITDFAGAIGINTTETSAVDDVSAPVIKSERLQRTITNASQKGIYYLVGESDKLSAVLTPAFDRDIQWSFDASPSNIQFNPSTGELSSTGAETRTLEAKVSSEKYDRVQIHFLEIELADKTDNTGATKSSNYKTTYTGSPIEPKVYSVKTGQGGDKTNLVDRMSSSNYSNNVNVGTASVVIPFTIDGVTYNFTKTFEIEKKPITAANFASATFTVDTSDDTVTAVSGVTGVDLVLDEDYTVTLSNRMTTSSGLNYTVHIDAVADGNYSGSFDLPTGYTITAANGLALEDYFQIYWDNGNTPQKNYTGSAIEFPQTTWASENLIILDEDGNYAYDLFDDTNVSYTNNINAGNAKMTFKLDGYSGQIDLSFRINPISLATATVDINGKGAGATYKYTGSAITPDNYGNPAADQIEVKLSGVTLEKGRDYTVSYTSNTAVGTAKAIIKGIGNYKNQVEQTFTITPNLLLNTRVEIDGSYEGNSENNFATGYKLTYGSSDSTGSRVTVWINNAVKTKGVDYDIKLSDDAEGTTALSDNVGTKYIIIEGKGDCAGEKIVATYSITQANIQTAGGIKLLWNAAGSRYNATKKAPVYTYTGNRIELERNDYTFTYKTSSKDLVKDTDFTVSYIEDKTQTGNNTNAGAVNVTFTGKGNYTGTKTLKFYIDPVTITPGMITLSPASGVYTGSKWEPSVEVVFNNKTVAPGDYDVDYNAYTAGTQLTHLITVNTDPNNGWPIKVTGNNNFKGSATVYFKINSKSSADLTFTINNKAVTKVDGYNYCADLNWIYTGKKHTGTLVIKDGGYTLEEGVDYTKTFKNSTGVKNIADEKTAGTLSDSTCPCVVITGAGNYSGINNVIYFNIDPRPITGAGVSITYNDKVPYTGSANTVPTDFAGVETSTDLSGGSYSLVKDRDFEIEYPSATDTTTAGEGKSFIIKGKGHYAGEITDKTYAIGESLSSLTLEVTNPINGSGFGKTNTEYDVPYMGTSYTPDTKLKTSTGVEVPESGNYDITRVSLTKDNSTTDIYNSYGSTNRIKVTCTGKNGYYGEVSYVYRITQLNLANAVTTLGETKGLYILVEDSKDYTYQYNTAEQDVSGSLSVKYVLGKSETAGDNKKNVVEKVICTLSYGSGATDDYTLASGNDSTAGKIGPDKKDGYKVWAKAGLSGNTTGMTRECGYNVVAADLAGATLTVKGTTLFEKVADSGEYFAYYTGSQIALSGADFTLVKDGKTLTYGKDYVIEYTSGGTDRGDAKITFYGANKSNYNQTQNGLVFDFKILAIDASVDTGFTVSVGSAYKYTGNAIVPTDVVVKYNNTVLEEGADKDYTLAFDNNVNPGKQAKVTVSGKGKYSGTKEAYFEIYLDLADTNTTQVTLDSATKVYDIDKTTGTATVTPTVNYKKADGSWVQLPMVTGTENNYKVEIDGEGKIPGKHMVEVVGLDDGTANCARGTFTFADVSFLADLSAGYDASAPYKAKYVTLTGTTNGDYPYTGGSVAPNINVLYSEAGIDKSWSSDLVGVGEKTLTLTATSTSQYYKAGSSVVLYYNVKYDLSSARLYTTINGTEQDYIYYTGNVINLGTDVKVAAVFGSDSTGTDLLGTFATARTPYDIKNPDNYTITVTAMSGAYVMGGPVYLPFEVKGKNFDSNFKITIGGVDYSSGTKYSTTYTGNEIQPAVSIINTATIPNTVLGPNDYSVTYTNNVYAGEATVTITGLGGYKGTTVAKTFTIEKKDADSSIKVKVPTTYYAGDGKELTPKIEITYNGKTLKEDVDFKIVDKVNWTPYAGDSNSTASFRVAFDSANAHDDPSFTGTDFEGHIDGTFTIERLSVNSTNVKIDQQTAEYTGKTITKADIANGLILKVGDVTLVQGTGKDYDIAILDENGNDITSAGISSRGTYQILVSGNNHCKDQRRITFTVTPRSIGKNWAINGKGITVDQATTACDITIEVKDFNDEYGYTAGKTAVFTPKQIEDGAIVITDKGVQTLGVIKTLELGKDYEIVTYRANTQAGEGKYSETEKDAYGNYKVEEGTPCIVIRGKGDYMEEELEIPFNIGKNINELNATVTGSDVQYTYNGKSQVPSLTITYGGGAGTILSSSNYSVAVEDVTDPANPITDATATINAGGANKKRLVITGRGAYYGTLYKNKTEKQYYTYTINPRQVPAYSYKRTYVDEANQDAVVTPVLTFDVKWKGQPMPKFTETVKNSLANGDRYDAYINYLYTVYDNEPVEPEIVITDLGLDKMVVSPDDYTITYKNNDISSNDNGGLIGCAEIKMQGNYVTTAGGVSNQIYKIYYLIIPSDLTEGKSDFEIVYTPGQYDWDGNPKTPKFYVQNKKGTILKESTDGGVTNDYIIDWGDNIAPGEVEFKVIGVNNYTGTQTGKFKIIADIKDTTFVTPIEGVEFNVDDPSTYDVRDPELPTQLYTGQPIKPSFKVILRNGNGAGKNILLEENVDYTYPAPTSANEFASSGTVAIYGNGSSGNYGQKDGPKTGNFNVEFDPTLIVVSGYKPKYQYQASEIRPNFVLSTPSGTVLPYAAEDVVYKRFDAFENDYVNTDTVEDIGMYRVEITVTLGRHTATKEVDFEIVPRSISDKTGLTALYATTPRYTGKALTPPITLYMKRDVGGLMKIDESNYTVSYINNTDCGDATIVLVANGGNYTGRCSYTFRIIPGKPALYTPTTTADSISLEWVNDIYASGVKLRCYDEDNVLVKEDHTKNTKYTFTGLQAGKTYRVELYSYIGAQYYIDEEYGKVVKNCLTGMEKAKLAGVSTSKGRATITWATDGNINAYYVYRSTTPNGEGARIALMPSSTGGYTDSSLESGKTYYYYVIGYKYVNGVRVDSPKSETISITVK